MKQAKQTIRWEKQIVRECTVYFAFLVLSVRRNYGIGQVKICKCTAVQFEKRHPPGSSIVWCEIYSQSTLSTAKYPAKADTGCPRSTGSRRNFNIVEKNPTGMHIA